MTTDGPYKKVVWKWGRPFAVTADGELVDVATKKTRAEYTEDRKQERKSDSKHRYRPPGYMAEWMRNHRARKRAEAISKAKPST